MEEWRTLENHEFAGAYEVSSIGRLRRRQGGPGARAGYLHRPTLFKNGYFAVTLTANGRRRKCYVHELVAHAFLGPRPPGLFINHKDSVPTNNTPSNLEYVTQGENIRHAAKMGRMGRRLSPQQVAEIRDRMEAGARNCDLAREYGVHVDTMWMIRYRRTWHHTTRVAIHGR